MGLENIINSGKRILGTSLLVGALAMGPFLGGCGKNDDNEKTHQKTETQAPGITENGKGERTRAITENLSKEEMGRYFPLAVGNEWTYKRTIMTGKSPKYRYMSTVLQDQPLNRREKGDRILRIGISPDITSRTENYTVVDRGGESFEIKGSIKGKDKNAQGIWPYELAFLDKLIWRVNKWGNNFVLYEIREGKELGCKVRCSEMIGTSNTHGGYEINVNPKIDSYHKKVMGIEGEKIEVPAGVFNSTIKNTFDFVAGVKFKDTKTIRYFAKDVGLIKEAQFDSDGVMTYKLELIDYKIE